MNTYLKNVIKDTKQNIQKTPYLTDFEKRVALDYIINSVEDTLKVIL